MEHAPKQENAHNFSKMQLDLEERRLQLWPKLADLAEKFPYPSPEYYELSIQSGKLSFGSADNSVLEWDAPERKINTARASTGTRQSLMEYFDLEKDSYLKNRLDCAGSIDDLEEIKSELDEAEEILNKYSVLVDTKKAA